MGLYVIVIECILCEMKLYKHEIYQYFKTEGVIDIYIVIYTIY